MRADEARILGTNPLLRGVSEADTRALAARGVERHFSAGRQIVREGDPGDALYTILAGTVRVAMTSEDGVEATLAVLRAGDSFGELALLDGELRSATVVATTATRALVVTREAFRAWLTERPEASAGLLRELSLRLRRTDAVLADFTFYGLRARLARRLLEISDSQPTAVSGQTREVRITQPELASMLGVSRESVNKELATLSAAGVLRTRRGAVEIVEIATLRESALGKEPRPHDESAATPHRESPAN